MSSSIPGLLCLCSEDYYSNSNIIQRVTISQASLAASAEERRVQVFEEESRRLCKVADSYPDIIEAEFHSEFLRISSVCFVDTNSDLVDQHISIIDGALLLICTAFIIMLDLFLKPIEAKCIQSIELDDMVFDDECQRLASLALTIDHSHIFEQECKRLSSLEASICRESEFEKECSRMSRLANTLTYEKEFHQEISRLASLVETVDNSHLFDRECRRISSLFEILYRDSPAWDCGEKVAPSSFSATELISGSAVSFESPKLSEAFTIRTFFRHILALSM